MVKFVLVTSCPLVTFKKPTRRLCSAFLIEPSPLTGPAHPAWSSQSSAAQAQSLWEATEGFVRPQSNGLQKSCGHGRGAARGAHCPHPPNGEIQVMDTTIGARLVCRPA